MSIETARRGRPAQQHFWPITLARGKISIQRFAQACLNSMFMVVHLPCPIHIAFTIFFPNSLLSSHLRGLGASRARREHSVVTTWNKARGLARPDTANVSASTAPMTFASKLRAQSLSLSLGSHCQPRVSPACHTQLQLAMSFDLHGQSDWVHARPRRAGQRGL